MRSAEIVDYEINATLYLYPGPESEPIINAADASLQKFLKQNNKNQSRRRARYFGGAASGVQRVVINSPANDIKISDVRAARNIGYHRKTAERMNSTLLPPSSTAWMRSTEAATARLSGITVAIRTLWTPTACPVDLLPYLAWALSVDRWDKDWPAERK